MIPLKKCNYAGCKKLIPYNQRYCPDHCKEIPYKKNSWSYDYRKKIYGKYQRFYHSTRWTRLSRSYRSRNPLCVECLKHGRYVKAQVVDHIEPIRTEKGWQERWNESNFQSLCIACHNRKTREDEKKFHFKKVADENY